MIRSSAVVLTALCLAVVGCGDDESTTTTDAPIGDGPFPVANLSVEVSHPERELDYQIGCQGDTATLTGDDAGSVDVDAQDACSALDTAPVRDLLVDGPPADRVCTEIYGGPDIARIFGTLDGSTVDVAIDRTNGCGISDWDQTLADVLPDALGVTQPDS